MWLNSQHVIFHRVREASVYKNYKNWKKCYLIVIFYNERKTGLWGEANCYFNFFSLVICCLLAFCIGLIFVQRSGNYFVTMFDDYSATLPLLIVVILENIAVSFVYGIDKWVYLIASSYLSALFWKVQSISHLTGKRNEKRWIFT